MLILNSRQDSILKRIGVLVEILKRTLKRLNLDVLLQADNVTFSFTVLLSSENGKVHTVVSKSKPSRMKVKSGAQLNMRGVYLHVLGDALGSVIVIISALIIKFASGKWTIYVDPGMSIFMVLLILKTSIPLMRESSLILLQTVPTHIKIKEVQDRLLDNVEGVLSVHEFHVWQLAGNKIIGELQHSFNSFLVKNLSVVITYLYDSSTRWQVVLYLTIL